MKANDYIHCSDLRRLTKAQRKSFTNYLALAGIKRAGDLWFRLSCMGNCSVLSVHSTTCGLEALFTHESSPSLKSRYSYNAVLRMVGLGNLV